MLAIQSTERKDDEITQRMQLNIVLVMDFH